MGAVVALVVGAVVALVVGSLDAAVVDVGLRVVGVFSTVTGFPRISFAFSSSTEPNRMPMATMATQQISTSATIAAVERPDFFFSSGFGTSCFVVSALLASAFFASGFDRRRSLRNCSIVCVLSFGDTARAFCSAASTCGGSFLYTGCSHMSPSPFTRSTDAGRVFPERV